MSNFEATSSDRLGGDGEQVAALTDFDQRVAQSLLKLTNSLRIPKDTLGYLVEYLALNQPAIPITQISGFTQFLGQESVAGAEVTTTSADVWEDRTGGPSLTGLPNGTYLFFFSATAKISAASGAAAKLGVNVNGTDATDAESAVTFTTVNVTISRVVKKTLSAGNNTVKIRYAVGSGAGETATFSRRELFALKIENL